MTPNTMRDNSSQRMSSELLLYLGQHDVSSWQQEASATDLPFQA